MLSSLNTLDYIFFTTLCLLLCWCYWKFVSNFKNIPTSRLEVKCFLNFIKAKFLEDTTFLSLCFQVFTRECQHLLKEGICVVWIFRPYIVIFNEELHKALSNDPAVNDRTYMHEILKYLLGNSLSTSDGERWKSHRKLMLPAFHLGILKEKMYVYNDNAKMLVKKLEDFHDMPITDIRVHFKQCTFKMITESILGVKYNEEKAEMKFKEFDTLSDKINKDIAQILQGSWWFLKFLLPYIPQGRAYLKRCSQLQKCVEEITEEMKRNIDTSLDSDDNIDPLFKKKKSFAQILFEHHQTDPSFTMQDIRDHVTQIIIAGYDTIALTMMWCLYLLGHHPDVQEQAFNEIKSLVDGEVTYEHLCNLKYLDGIIKETLRLYPPAPIYARKCTKDIKIGKYEIPKGSEVALFIYLLQRNPDIYPNPETFDPERFSENSEIRPWSFTPFAEGYRDCIGKKASLMELKVLLVHVLQHFEIKALDKIKDHDLQCLPLLSPGKPIRIILSIRKDDQRSSTQESSQLN